MSALDNVRLLLESATMKARAVISAMNTINGRKTNILSTQVFLENRHLDLTFTGFAEEDRR